MTSLVVGVLKGVEAEEGEAT